MQIEELNMEIVDNVLHISPAEAGVAFLAHAQKMDDLIGEMAAEISEYHFTMSELWGRLANSLSQIDAGDTDELRSNVEQALYLLSNRYA